MFGRNSLLLFTAFLQRFRERKLIASNRRFLQAREQLWKLLADGN